MNAYKNNYRKYFILINYLDRGSGKILNINPQEAKKNNFLKILIFLLGVFLHQSAITIVGNTSIADIILIFLLIYLFVNKDIKFKKNHLLLTVFFMTYLLFVSVFYAPILFNITVSKSTLMIEVIKLTVLFLYFHIGKELAKKNEFKYLLKIYSNSALLVAIIVLFFSIVNIQAMNPLMFKFFPRTNGFMLDPNYFSILQITALPFFIKNTKMNKKYRYFGIIMLIISIVLSGSKTGLVTLFLYLLLNQIEIVFLSMRKKTLRKKVKSYIIFLLVIFGLIVAFSNLTQILDAINDLFPASIRVTKLFTDFESAISSDGSSRSDVWGLGVRNIKKSPILGVGIGNYGIVGQKLYGSHLLSHNTYIQLAAEWGLPVTIMFFLTIFLRIIKVTFKYNRPEFHNLSVTRDMLVILLIGSIGISLNNARIFWLLLGSFMHILSSIDKEKKT